MDLSIVVPVYNEEEDLWVMAEDLAKHLDRIIGVDKWGYVFVDNGSIDRSPTIINEIIKKWQKSKLIQLEKPDYGNALFHGIANSPSDFVFIINVDFWDEYHLEWGWKNRYSYDLILGSKRADMTINNQPKYRRLLSQLLNTALQFGFGFVGSDTHGPKILNLKKMNDVIDQCVMRRGQFDTEFTIRAQRLGLRIAEVPVPYEELRSPRNFMVKKIKQNLVDIFRLKKTMKKIPVGNCIRYNRWSREDVVNGSQIKTNNKTSQINS